VSGKGKGKEFNYRIARSFPAHAQQTSMNPFISNPRVLALIVAVWYFFIGYGSAVLDPSLPARMRFAWRFAAWIACFVAFAIHIGFLRFKFRKSPLSTALNVSMAVALGGFMLAVAATIHAAMVPSHAPYWQFLIALIVWPLITALPAFVIALPSAWLLTRFTRRAKRRS
jgi:hypothetical protein